MRILELAKKKILVMIHRTKVLFLHKWLQYEKHGKCLSLGVSRIVLA